MYSPFWSKTFCQLSGKRLFPCSYNFWSLLAKNSFKWFLTSWFEVKVHSQNFAECGTSNSPKVPSLQNMVGMLAHPIQTAIAFGELSNLYDVSHYPAGIVQIFIDLFRSLLSAFWVQHLICPAVCNKLYNYSLCCPAKKLKINDLLEIAANGQHTFFSWLSGFDVVWAGSSFLEHDLLHFALLSTTHFRCR